MGVQVPREAWGDHVLSMATLAELNAYWRSAGAQGVMVWSLNKPDGSNTGMTPQAIAQRVCSDWGMGACDTPLGV